ncbi:Protein of unknown function DUF778 domain-containing protein [Rozella allomycis CSF55]|uniref:DUF778-domain-containing protein n=1 Tax=Rozella allomycis (strain CSF55) TaxID=988480 RepID=A0A075AXQ1_ROZAC|nr:Protein of unknown function DUF778 domain-containing protein [Rozella allomycis CSF55]|eukprot:EPZ33329.1 Protein of unknown function DUF778 domain-containing protein [Rozella allomycis CSF55]
MLPVIGHVGITDSTGTVFDFAGPFHIGRGNLAFGAPTRYLQYHIEKNEETEWDSNIEISNQIFGSRMHNLITCNCHHHVLYAINGKELGFIDVLKIALKMFFFGTFIDKLSVILLHSCFDMSKVKEISDLSNDCGRFSPANL